jgi:hypothetical protein
MAELWVEALLFRPAVTVSGARPADERAWLMSASTWAAASLEVAPAGLDDDADGEEEAEGGDEEGPEERPGLDGAELDGAEPDGDEADGDEDDEDEEDGADEGPPATGCLPWARDGVGRANRGTDGLAVTAPNG